MGRGREAGVSCHPGCVTVTQQCNSVRHSPTGTELKANKKPPLKWHFLPSCNQEILICTLIWPSIAGEITWDVSFVTLNFLMPGLLIVISYSKILQVRAL